MANFAPPFLTRKQEKVLKNISGEMGEWLKPTVC
jgi:hypothetical protein